MDAIDIADRPAIWIQLAIWAGYNTDTDVAGYLDIQIQQVIQAGYKIDIDIASYPAIQILPAIWAGYNKDLANYPAIQLSGYSLSGPAIKQIQIQPPIRLSGYSRLSRYSGLSGRAIIQSFAWFGCRLSRWISVQLQARSGNKNSNVFLHKSYVSPTVWLGAHINSVFLS